MSFIGDKSYQALRNSLDEAWVRQQVHSNNIANAETPGYKAKSVSFEDVFRKAAEGKAAGWEHKAILHEDHTTAGRPDGNNVSVDNEEMEMWQAYAQYSAVSRRITGKLSNLRYVVNNTAK